MGLLLLLITFLLLLKKGGGSVPNIIGIHETLPKSISKENWRSKEETNHPNNRIVKINKNTEDRVQALRGIFCPPSEPPGTTGMKNQWVNN